LLDVLILHKSLLNMGSHCQAGLPSRRQRISSERYAVG
jgi:hypothetical protein